MQVISNGHLQSKCAIIANMTKAHTYGLTWIDEEALFQTSKNIFSKSLGLTKPTQKKLPIDPFSFVLQSKATGIPLKDMDSAEEVRVLNKRISDAVGNWHQSVLALAPKWQCLGTNGGVLDIRTIDGYLHPKWGKPIVAEVKNRFNTIKASDEKRVWEDIDRIARCNGDIGYLIQIVPKQAVLYDEPWTPSGVQKREHVRHCDGATGYALVFDYENALSELIDAFPKIVDDILLDAGKTPESFSKDSEVLEEKKKEVFGI